MPDTPYRPRRPGGTPKGKRPGSARPARGAPAHGKPSASGERPRSAPSGDRPERAGDKPTWRERGGQKREAPKRDGQTQGGQRGDGQRRDDQRQGGQRRDGQGHGGQGHGGQVHGGQKRDGERRLWTRDGKPARGDASARERETPGDRDPYGTKSVRPRHDAPEIPEDVTPNQLDRVARAQLKTLSKENADEVARHLVMAARLIGEDPELAHRHALSAERRAGRIAVVRETLAITAYATGDFALALRELRTYRRISGRDDQLPMMVDSERGLGRPERALELGRSVPRASLPVEVQVELAIAMSGARLDLGQTEAALVELQIPQLDPDTAFSWSPALFDAYATVLEDLGRAEEAELWFTRSDLATAALASDDDADDLEIEVFEEEVEPDESSNEGGVDE